MGAVKYRTIVADPPWPYPGGVSAGGTPGKPVKSFALPYPSMDLEMIGTLPVPSLAHDDAWLACWATNRHLEYAFVVLKRWGFRYRQIITWNKPGASPFGGTLTANGAEFLLIAARGNPEVVGRWPGTSVITHNRLGTGSHSRKPDVFQDMLEACCPGPYLELFARRQRLGWDTWGNEALGHVEMPA